MHRMLAMFLINVVFLTHIHTSTLTLSLTDFCYVVPYVVPYDYKLPSERGREIGL